MMYAQALILLTLSPAYLCQDVNNLFKSINDKVLRFNAIAADIAWESSINPGNPNLPRQASILQEERIKWEQETCEQLAAPLKNHLINSTYARQTYLLCRGPKFRFNEARPLSNLYEELQTIYTEAEICIPSSENITIDNIKEVEAAVLKYIITVSPKYDKEDLVSTAAKANTEVKEGFCLKGEDDFEKVMKTSRNEAVLRWTWLVWREKVGPPMKEPYRRLVDLENAGARRNGYEDIGAAWRDELETPHLRQLCQDLYEEVKPLYTLVHGVVRFYLRKHYGDIVSEKGPIPAHLLGNLWSQNWEPLIDLITPKNIDLDQSIRKLNWTVSHMVKRAEDFYQSFGLPAMTDIFWQKSVFARGSEDTRCHGTAADMFKVGDYRMLYCSDTTKEDFYILHHEMGHVQYYMAYEKQPALFRQANTALHESIGDAIMYGVMTPQHLHRLGLINDSLLYIIDKPKIKEQDNDLTKEVYNGFIKRKHSNLRTGFEENNVKQDKKLTKEVYKGFIQRKHRNLPNRFEENNVKDKSNAFEELHGENDVKNTVFEKTDDKEVKNGFIKRKHRNLHTGFERANVNDKSYVYDELDGENDVEDNAFDKTDYTLMLKQALNKIPQIPFSLLIDEFRWKYFEGGIQSDDVNKMFWQMALELQGIAPTNERGEEYFDAGAKFHVPDNTPYIRYFLSSFIQHQLFESLCKAAIFGRRDGRDTIPDTIPLNRCDIYGSKTAGKLLKDLMSRGHSQHWRDILQQTTGASDISASSLQRYYRPLYNVLMKLVQKYDIPIGWDDRLYFG